MPLIRHRFSLVTLRSAIVVSLLMACNDVSITAPSVTPFSTATATQASLEPTAANPQETPTILPRQQIRRSCATMVSPEQTNLLDKGSLIYGDRVLLQAMILSEGLLQSTTLVEDYVSVLYAQQISPYSGTLFWEDKEVAHALFASGELTQFEIPNHTYFRQWMIDDKVMLGVGGGRPFEQLLVGKTDEYFILSPDDASLEHHEVPLPDFLWNVKSSFLSYSPNYDRVLFSAEINGDFPIVLWDIENGALLWSGGAWLSRSPAGLSAPEWNAQGTEAVITLLESDTELYGPEFYGISSDGVEKRLTYLNDIRREVYTIRYPRWSPNNRYIALMIETRYYRNPQRLYQVLVLDVENGSIFDYCLEADRLAQPIWSPDGTKIAFETDDGRAIIILNMTTGKYQVALSAEEEGRFDLIGWVPWELSK